MQGRDENDQEPQGNSQTNTQLVIPTADVPTDDVVIVGDRGLSTDVVPLSYDSIEEEH